MFNKAKKGFTLIELLVVIAIIGFLVSIAIFAFNSTRINARDTKRMADAKEIQKALEVYYDHYKEYPDYLDSDKNDGGWDHSHVGDGFIKGLEDNTRGDNSENIQFMSKVPVEMTVLGDASLCGGANNDLSYTYLNYKPGHSVGDRQVYALCIAFENTKINFSGTDFKKYCDNGSYPVYCLYGGD